MTAHECSQSLLALSCGSRIPKKPRNPPALQFNGVTITVRLGFYDSSQGSLCKYKAFFFSFLSFFLPVFDLNRKKKKKNPLGLFERLQPDGTKAMSLN